MEEYTRGELEEIIDSLRIVIKILDPESTLFKHLCNCVDIINRYFLKHGQDTY